jgi:hypothetical protein
MTIYIITINCPKTGTKDVTIKAESENVAKMKIASLHPNCDIQKIRLLLLD